MRIAALAVGAVLSCCTLSGIAHADERANAEILFRDGRTAMDAHDYEKACVLFEQSLKAEDTIGTLLNLALCNKARGKIATAWGQFSAVSQRALAMVPRQDARAEFAQAEAAALEKRLPRVRLTMSNDDATLKVTIDDADESRELWGRGIPVDLGKHTIVVASAQKKPWTHVVTVDAESAVFEVTVPPLEDRPPSPIGATDPNATPHGHRTLGFVLGGVGIASLATMGVFGVLAAGKASDAKNICPSPCSRISPTVDNPNYASAAHAHSLAETYANVANVTAAVSALAIGIGAYFVFTSNSGKKAAVRIAPSISANGPTMTILGEF